jgi:hypothetical protein
MEEGGLASALRKNDHGCALPQRLCGDVRRQAGRTRFGNADGLVNQLSSWPSDQRLLSKICALTTNGVGW